MSDATSTATLVEFLRARLDEDSALANATAPSGRRLCWITDVVTDDDEHVVGFGVVSSGDADVAGVAEAYGLERGTGGNVAEHIARHDPARVLREVEAKRQIIEREQWTPHGGLECGGHPRPYMPHGDYGPGYCRRMDEENPTLRDLAMVYIDHPDYRPEWCPRCDGAGIVPGTEEPEINATGKPCECLLHHPDYSEEQRP